MSESDDAFGELGDVLEGAGGDCFKRSAKMGPTMDGARWLLVGSMLYALAIAMKQRPDLLEAMSFAMHRAIELEPRSVRRLLAEVRKVASCN